MASFLIIMNKKLIQGHLALLAANAIWGLYAPIGKAFMNSNTMSVWALSGIKIIGAAALLWIVSMFLPDSMQARQTVERKDLLQLFFASLLVIAGNQVLILLGLSYADPVDATVICSMAPIFVLVLAFILYRQTIEMLKVVGIVLGFAGVMLYSFGGEVNAAAGVTHPIFGDMLCVGSQVCGALYLIMFGKVIGKYSAITLMKWMFLFSAIVIAPITATDIASVEWGSITYDAWMQLAFIVVFATGVAYLLLPIGQVSVKPTVVAMYNYLQPVVAAICALVVGLSDFTLESCVAAVLVLLGVYIVSKPSGE